MGSTDDRRKSVRHFFIGVGVGSYEDHTLDLPKAETDVVRIADWFTQRSGVPHEHALADLGKSPRAAQVIEALSDFLKVRDPGDVVVIYFACHGELEGVSPHLFGSNTPRRGLAGKSIEARTLGTILGQSPPHNVLLIVDACVSGLLCSSIQFAAQSTAIELNTRDPHRRHAQAVVASTFGRDPALDGCFVDAFLRVVSDERWTGTTSAWVAIDQLIEGLNQELKEIAPTQVAERSVWGPNIAELIPNPNVASRRRGQLIADEEFLAHFDPSARGVARGEAGSLFTGRVRELQRIVQWLQTDSAQPLLVITGSPGSGKSALLSRVAVLCDPAHRPDETSLSKLAAGTVPPANALDAVIWCHNKAERQIIEEIAASLGGSASTPDALLQLAIGRTATIAIDALDETQEGMARQVAVRVLKPLAKGTRIRLLVATRRRPVYGRGVEDLVGALGVDGGAVIDLDESPDGASDMRAYVEARMRSDDQPHAHAALRSDPGLADRIADAAGHSFLVASIAARSAAAGRLARVDGVYVLPTEVGEALASYIDALPNPRSARALLRPLAWSHGAGLPWGTLWASLATALARVEDAPGTSYRDDDVHELLDSAGELVVESVQWGQPVYRLFHEALAEYLRGDTTKIEAHHALAQVMLDLAQGRPWPQVQRYITASLPAHLLGAGRMEELVELLADPTWDRSLREGTGDPLAAVGIVDAAIDRLLTEAPTDLRSVPLCVSYSRAMTTAAPLILDVLVRSGQFTRAEMMANNLAFAPDRMAAYRYLCEGYARERDWATARRCLEEVRRSRPAMPAVHQPMAWCWIAEAALDAGQGAIAKDAALAAVDAAFAVEGDGWDRPNGYFWAARACSRIGWDNGTDRIRLGLDQLGEGIVGRNQALQAASISRHIAFLETRLAEYLDHTRYPRGMIRDGNLALALVHAGMSVQAARVFALVADGVPQGEADSIKRWVWALAASGQMERAVRALDYVHDPIERGKAIARIAAEAIRRQDETALKAVVPHAKTALLNTFESRSRARLIRTLWLAGSQSDSLSLAEQEISTAHANTAMADPRDGIGARALLLLSHIGMSAVKAGKREMVSSVVAVDDATASYNVEIQARQGNLALARESLASIIVPLYRARALAAIAKHDPDPERAVATWLRAVADARRAGRGVVDEVLPVGTELLGRAGRTQDAQALASRIETIDTRWEMESFSEQYDALRRTLPPGSDRTSRMTALMFVPRRLATTHRWTSEDLLACWNSGDDGKRLFALGLIQGNGGLANADMLVEGIRRSRSAFEQYHALLAAEQSKRTGEEWNAVRGAVEAELRGDPRDDGTSVGIREGSSRMTVARRLLGG